MHFKDLIHTTSSGETQTIEFKQSFGDGVIETLTAFANTKGGKVYIGIADENKIYGVHLGKETLQNWINEIKQKTSPAIIPDIEEVCIDNKTIAVLEITEFPVKPVSFKGRYFKRVRNSNHRMTISEISDAHIKTVNSSWDFYPDPEHTIENLSEEKIYYFMDQIGLEMDLITFLNKFEFIKNEKITFGAFLLFAGGEPLISTIEIGRFSSETIIKDSITIRTDLLTQVDLVIEFIKKHINKSYVITGKLQREERWEYPMDAIREIVVNMIVHRDYQSPDDSIIKIFDDHIEFFNPGKLIDNLTIEQVISGKYRSHLRNKQIANIFKEAGIIENMVRE